MKKTLAVLLFALMIFVPSRSFAASSLGIVFEDILWGGGIGVLLGTASMAFLDHPGDHTQRIYQGAAIGVVAGLGYGIYEISPMFKMTSYTNPKTGEVDKTYGVTVRIPIK